MKLHLENIAKIERADIEIDGITVIAGSNNTGKSTIGKVLFALFEAFYNIEEFVQDWKPNDAKKILKKHGGNLDLICKKLSGAKRRKVSLVDELQGRYAYILANCKGESKIVAYMREYCKEHLQLYDIVEQFQCDEIQYWLNVASMDMSENMMNYGSEYAEKIGIERVFQSVFGGQIVKRAKFGDVNKDVKQAIATVEINSKEQKAYKMQNSVVFENDSIRKVEQEFTVETKALYIENPRVLKQFSMLGYENNESVAKKKIEFWLRPNGEGVHYSRYGNAYRMNLWQEENIDDNMKSIDSNFEMQRMDELVTEVNQELVQLVKGSIEFTKTNQPLEFKDDSYSEAFSLTNLSTGLKAISLLQCILHYRVLKPRSVLILDEPEINLHPEWQVKYAQFIAILQARLDLHIVVTTHSPFFLKAIENAALENNIENRCHYYYADTKDGDAILRCVDENIESVYSKMMMPLFDMIADMGL